MGREVSTPVMHCSRRKTASPEPHRAETVWLLQLCRRLQRLLLRACRQDPKNEAPVIVAVKDLGEVDNDYFLIPVGIRDHEGGLHASFPVENRLLPQGAAPFSYQPTVQCGTCNARKEPQSRDPRLPTSSLHSAP